MPALTHGRVKNGFNLYSRTITYAQNSCKDANGNILSCCLDRNHPPSIAPCGGQKDLCCGKPIIPSKYNYSNGGGLCRVPKGPSTRDRALASGGVGSRSFAVKRAIGRRVQNRNQVPKGSTSELKFVSSTKGFDFSTGVTTTFGAECPITPCACCLPTPHVLQKN